jgi:PPOX class probable F420-dependent enzyme
VSDTTNLDQDVVTLAREGRSFATITTLAPDGTPMTQPMWIDTDGQHLLLNTEVHRQKFRNIERDPRVTVLIVEQGNPINYVEVRGEVVEKVRGPEARAHIDALAKKYTGSDTYPNTIKSERVMLKVAPRRVSRFTP